MLQSLVASERYYVGLTHDVVARLCSHNEGQSPQTARHRPWRLHVVMQFANEDIARRFEKFLKSASGRAFAKQHFQ
jgi:predicted GIY-YIG superfamily endonuclease